MHLPDKRNSSSSFVISPSSVRFEEQREGEMLYLMIRKHWITNVPWIAVCVALFALPFIGHVFLSNFFPDIFGVVNGIFQFLVYVFWYVALFVYAFEQFLLWFFTINIITGDRIVDIDFHGLFSKDFAEVQLIKIQDVHSEVVGPVAVMFNYGTVTVQTAAEQTIIEFDHVPHPDQISKFIGELVAEKSGHSVNTKES